MGTPFGASRDVLPPHGCVESHEYVKPAEGCRMVLFRVAVSAALQNCCSSTVLIWAPVRSSVATRLLNGWGVNASPYQTSPGCSTPLIWANTRSARMPPGFMNAILALSLEEGSPAARPVH